MGVYMCTTVIATFFSIAIGLLMFHGGVPQMGTVTEGGGGVSVSLLDMIVNVVPENLVQPIVNRDMLQIIFVSILFGVTLNMLGEKAQMLKDFTETANTFCLRVSFGVPVEAAAIVLGIDPLTSMFRTTINTMGDIAVTTALSKNEGMMDEAVYMGTEG